MPLKERRADFYTDGKPNRRWLLAAFEEVYHSLDPVNDRKKKETNAVFGRYFGIKYFHSKGDERFIYSDLNSLISDVFDFDVRIEDDAFVIKTPKDEEWNNYYSGRIELLRTIYGLELQKLPLDNLRTDLRNLYNYFNR